MFLVLRHYGLRVAIEPASLSWTDIMMTKVRDTSNEFYCQRMVSLANLLRKGDNLSLKSPYKSKETFKPDQVENLNERLFVVSVMHVLLFERGGG